MLEAVRARTELLLTAAEIYGRFQLSNRSDVTNSTPICPPSLKDRRCQNETDHTGRKEIGCYPA